MRMCRCEDVWCEDVWVEDVWVGGCVDGRMFG